MRVVALLLACIALSLDAAEGKLTVTGSSTIAPIVAEIAKRFEAKHPGVRVDVQTGGSSRGVQDVASGLADIGMASRELKPEEEEIVRRAAKRVNEKVQEFQEQYAAKDKQDYLAMCALMSEVEVLANKEKVVISDTTFFDKLREIEELLSDMVSR